jgi:hypothetical protein
MPLCQMLVLRVLTTLHMLTRADRRFARLHMKRAESAHPAAGGQAHVGDEEVSIHYEMQLRQTSHHSQLRLFHIHSNCES